MNRCPKCGCLPTLKKNDNKFYYECSGDCWNQTHKHWNEEDARKEWNDLSKEESVIPMYVDLNRVRELFEDVTDDCTCPLHIAALIDQILDELEYEANHV